MAFDGKSLQVPEIIYFDAISTQKSVARLEEWLLISNVEILAVGIFRFSTSRIDTLKRMST